MLKIINPKDQKNHKIAIESFLDLLKVYQNFELSLEQKKKATFLIAEDQRYGVYGGAVLFAEKTYQFQSFSKVETYEEKFSRLFEDFQPNATEYWRARTCFCLAVQSVPNRLEWQDLYLSFFHDLHESLMAFGDPKEIEFITITSFSLDAIHQPYHRKWPHCMPVKFSHAKDGLRHGILSLKGAKFMPDWRKQDFLDDSDENEVFSRKRVA